MREKKVGTKQVSPPWTAIRELVRVLLAVTAMVIVNGCSQLAPSRPEQIASVQDAIQAIDYLAAMVAKQDYDDHDSLVEVFAQRHGDAEGSAAMLLAYGKDAAAWLRTRTLASEAEAYYMFDLSPSVNFSAYQLRVHKHTSVVDAMDDEGIELYDSAGSTPSTSSTSMTIASGIKHFLYNEGPISMHAVVLDRSHREYELRIAADENTGDGTFHGHYVDDFARSLKALAAVNGSLWRCPEETTWLQCHGVLPGGKFIPTGIVVADGDQHGTPGPGEIIIGASRAGQPNGVALIPSMDWKPQSPMDYPNAVGISAFEKGALRGRPQYVLKNGQCQPLELGADLRSAIGYGKDAIVLLSSHNSHGKVDAPDLCPFFQRHGVTEAVLLDGGFSTQMYVQNAGGLDNLVNSGVLPKGVVANAIGFVKACQVTGESCSANACCGGLTCDNGVCRNPVPTCTPDWSCTPYSACSNGVRNRTCTDLNQCGTTSGKPLESMACASRINIRRLHGSNGLGCQNPSADWDHCHTINGTTCLAGQSGSLSYSPESPPSHEQFWVTTLTSAPGEPDTAVIDGVLMSRLDACYHAGATLHVLEPQDKLKADGIENSASQGINGWSCVRAGYVRTGSIVTSDSHMVPTYRIKIPNKSSAFISPVNTTGDPTCDVQNTGVAWFAWDAP